MAELKRTVSVNAGFGERPYTKDEFVNAWMNPVYDTVTLLLSSKDKKELGVANELPGIAKKLAEERFENLYKDQQKKKEEAA